MTIYFATTDGTLQHHGVKGMRWGVRRARKHAGPGRYVTKKRQLDGDKRDLETMKKGGHLSVGLTKKRQEAFDRRDKAALEKRIDKSLVSEKPKGQQPPKPGKKINREKLSNITDKFKQKETKEQAVKIAAKGAKIAGKALKYSLIDDIFLGGAGKKVAKATVKTTGRAVISAYIMARGGWDIRWYDN